MNQKKFRHVKRSRLYDLQSWSILLLNQKKIFKTVKRSRLYDLQSWSILLLNKKKIFKTVKRSILYVLPTMHFPFPLYSVFSNEQKFGKNFDRPTVIISFWNLKNFFFRNFIKHFHYSHLPQSRKRLKNLQKGFLFFLLFLGAGSHLSGVANLKLTAGLMNERFKITIKTIQNYN